MLAPYSGLEVCARAQLDQLGLSVEHIYQLFDRFHLASGLPLRRRIEPFDFNFWRQINAQSIDGDILELFFASLHDSGQRGVTGFIEPQIGAD